MSSRVATCAIALSIVSGCALAHERETELVHPVVLDAAAPDTPSIDVDAGPPEACAARWEMLPWCPADTASLRGQHCDTEGLGCGTRCCEPGPAISCVGGVWTAATAPSCENVDCAAPTPCGSGACGPERLCLHTSSEVRLPERCVTPPFSLSACEGAPDGWLTDDPRSCFSCRCEGVPMQVWLDCACCDS